MTKLTDLLGSYDNLNDAPSLLNHPSNILAITIVFVIFYFGNAFYPTSAGLIKLALLFQYLRVYDKGSVFRKATKVMICVVAIWSISFSVFGWIPTWPVEAYWNLEMPAFRYGFGSLYLGPFVSIYVSLTATNMVLDVIVLGLAAPLLLVNKKPEAVSRWSLVSLFGLGSLASVMSIWRLAAIIETQATTKPTFDPTWYGAMPIVLAVLEVDIATITASLPVFWPVLQQLHQNQILVTREVKIVREERRRNTAETSSDRDDEGIELQRSESALQLHSNKSEHYGDPYVAEQVNPFRRLELQFGTKAEIDVSPLGRKTSITSYRMRDTD
ncbi:hypothetical protein M406DRAFT_350304 [Cryphonectria parasitica EP155]|uniref:Rhodopsin domain-containing protein n=1 Tax=Cryphonectria parasitica (strain ATCC 38755 / EP155) TaxID=660469 RepID=A0A9P5CR45_CRYP1|nr:uncharacterized protein M406DRAFT_350304 [Cryphonectria parasitica EP155]KAF3766881.1 hypothetical protein M406DRAFT_350304 [Cryphonectria parasitica EP155]